MTGDDLEGGTDQSVHPDSTVQGFFLLLVALGFAVYIELRARLFAGDVIVCKNCGKYQNGSEHDYCKACGLSSTELVVSRG